MKGMEPMMLNVGLDEIVSLVDRRRILEPATSFVGIGRMLQLATVVCTSADDGVDVVTMNDCSGGEDGDAVRLPTRIRAGTSGERKDEASGPI